MAGSLTSHERRVLRAVVDTLVPPGGGLPGGLELGLVDDVEARLVRFSPFARRLVRAVIHGYDLTPLLSRHLRPFHRLGAEARSDWVQSSSQSRLAPRRDAISALESLVQVLYASRPELREAIGYDGLPLVPVDWDQIAPAAPLPVRKFPELTSGDISCDVVIVGSGAGGAVAASMLAQAGLKVVVLEEGGLFDRRDFRAGPPVDRLFELYRDNGLTATLGSPMISLPMGRAVGGTTVVNSGTCFRTPDAVLEAWAGDGLPAVGPDEMGPVFDAVEKRLGVRGVPDEVLGANGDVMLRGARRLGLSSAPIRRNIRDCHGHGVCAFGCPLDAKQAMHVTFLPDAVAAGAQILSGVRVRSIWMEATDSVGVVAEVLHPDRSRRAGVLRVRARHTVVAAGAIFTPALLLRQRLANSSGQLGRNLVIHPGAGTTARFAEELRAWRGTMQSSYVDEKLDSGILLEATFPPPGIGYSAGSLPGWGRDKDLFTMYPRMASAGSIVSDCGNGRVRPLGRRGALVRYDLSSGDAAKVLEGIALAAEIFLAAGAEVVYPMLPGLPQVSTPAEAGAIRGGRWKPSELHLSAYHPMGTARMGTDPRRSVVDPWGSVWDVGNLSILDASILPSSTQVNPQISIMAMVSRCAARLAGSLT